MATPASALGFFPPPQGPTLPGTPNPELIRQLIAQFGIPGQVPPQVAAAGLDPALMSRDEVLKRAAGARAQGRPPPPPGEFMGPPRPPPPRPGLFARGFGAMGGLPGLAALGGAGAATFAFENQDPDPIGFDQVLDALGGLGPDPEVMAARRAARLEPPQAPTPPEPAPAPSPLSPFADQPTAREITSPFSAFTPFSVDFPEVPDIQTILSMMEGAQPLPPSEISSLPFVLQGIAGNVRDTSGSVGNILLQAGLGGLGGLGVAQQTRQSRLDAFDRESREFLKEMATTRAKLEQGEFANLLDLEQSKLEIEKANQLGRAAEQAQFAPTISGGAVITRRREGDQIVHKIERLPSEKEAMLRHLMPMMQLLAQSDTGAVFDAIMGQDPDAIMRAANALQLGLAGGQTKVEDIDKARIVAWIRHNEPDLMARAVDPLIQMRTFIEALR